MCILVTDIHTYKVTEWFGISHNKEIGDLCFITKYFQDIEFQKACMYLVIYGLLYDLISSLSAQQLMVSLVYNELERKLGKNCILLRFPQIHTTMWVSFLTKSLTTHLNMKMQCHSSDCKIQYWAWSKNGSARKAFEF